jgi:hypothetical protein
VRLEGDAEIAKVGAPVIVRLTGVVVVRLPDVPVMVRVDVPAAAVLAAVNVRVLLPEVTAPNDAVTPVGSPVAAKATVPVKPFWGVIVTVLVALAP